VYNFVLFVYILVAVGDQTFSLMRQHAVPIFSRVRYVDSYFVVSELSEFSNRGS